MFLGCSINVLKTEWSSGNFCGLFRWQASVSVKININY
jgi:hypothetical protein